MKYYSACDESVRDRLNAMITKFHPELKAAEVRVDLVFVRLETEDADKPALTHGGYSALAVVRILPVKARALGRGDAEIEIDQHKYEQLKAKEQDALLDHELYHLLVVMDGKTPERDTCARPVLKMRKHDRQFGWFDAIAKRHGEHSGEVRQAHILIEDAQQAYFPFMKSAGARAA